jgi:phospho-N-acetylmuramoyl-pentapeptide-transferase
MISLLMAGGVSFVCVVAITPLVIRWLTHHHVGQQVRSDGPARHSVKAGTPTMGGTAIVCGALLGYLVGHWATGEAFSRMGILVAMLLIGGAAVGFVDDFVKVTRQRSLGLSKKAKFSSQLLVALGFALAAHFWAHEGQSLTFVRGAEPGIVLALGLWVVWIMLLVVGSANAVNLTDGLDGLAAGSAALIFAALSFIGYWEFRHEPLYHVAPSLDLGMLAFSLAGACAGFLWWNAAPAKIFMGDTGSLALGGVMAGLCIALGLQLLLAILGGLYVVVTLSVVIQVISYRLFHKRVFRMAPIHHHFELKGWPETTVIVRFWVVGGIFTATGLVAFYAGYLAMRGGK